MSDHWNEQQSNSRLNNKTDSAQLVQIKFSWVISNLVDSMRKSKYVILSTTFSYDVADMKVKWDGVLMNSTSLGKNCVTIAIHSDQSEEGLKAKFDITVLDAFNQEIFTKTGSDIDFTLEKFHVIDRIPMEMLMSKNNELGKHSKITLIYTCTMIPYFEIEKRRTSKELSKLDCLNSLAKLVNNKQFSDVVLKVGGKELYAYKGILAGRSPVFLAMFSHNMKESRCNHVIIKDISYETMYNLLQYIYTDSDPQFDCNESQEKYKCLLIAADKYDLKNLKIVLEEKLISDIQVCNVFEYLNFADSYNAIQLKKKAIDFITSHKHEIARSEVYKKFNDLNPGVSCEVFHSLLTKKRKLE